MTTEKKIYATFNNVYYHGLLDKKYINICNLMICPIKITQSLDTKKKEEIDIDDLKNMIRDFMAASDFPYDVIKRFD